jgi:hypothetical protein
MHFFLTKNIFLLGIWFIAKKLKTIKITIKKKLMYQEGEKYIYLIKTPFPYSYISFFFFVKSMD